MTAERQTLIRQLLRFAVVGLVNTVLGVGMILFSYHVLSLGPVLSNATGYALGFIVSFVLHRSFTFEHDAPVRRSLPRYGLVLGAGYGVNLLVLQGLLHGAGASFLTAQLCALVSFSGFVFIGSRMFAFDPTTRS